MPGTNANVRAANRRSARRTRLRSALLGAQAAEWEAADEARAASGDARKAKRWSALASRAQRRQQELRDRLERLK
jgi:hypothetical protein